MWAANDSATGGQCKLCRRSLETSSHLCFECPWPNTIWDLVGVRFRLPSLCHENWPSRRTLFEWFKGLSRCRATDRSEARTIALTTLWEIWLERNRRIFQGVELSPGQLVSRIQETVGLWNLAFGSSRMLRE
ncbi:hypothetical protein BRADI_2g22535v3 [Brachypodium distachyon]|uniref:Reverse transcriptase zinc-binding domain-containing protein n=1 Tax=Brachypodium distachyon TaxID=15368 RepID=A0A2K2D9W3_BRADI|nr:hypothetical protein BRADI_2g22535v3 [Brachypodium distachyon]